MTTFTDRADAGRELASRLDEYRRRPETIVLGLPRGGVPVAYEVARSLELPLDVLVVRKLGAPGQPEFAVGAIASGGVTVVNEDVPASVCDDDALAAEASVQLAELRRREKAYRGTRPELKINNRTVILVDDGAATGSSMLAAIRASRKLGARTVIVALPVASAEAHENLSREADRLVCISVPASFFAVGTWYRDFGQTTDAEVRDLLARADMDG